MCLCLQATLECSDSFRWPHVDWQAVPRFRAGGRECAVAELDSRPWHQEVAAGGRVERSSCWHECPLYILTIRLKRNKCVSKTDTNPPFAFQIAFPRSQISQGFYREGQKVETYNRKFPFESNLESNRQIVVYSFSVKFFLIAVGQMCGFVKNIARSLLGYYCACSNYKYMN